MSRCRITPPVHAADPPGCHQLSSRRKSAQVPPSSQPLSDAPSAPAPISPPSERSRSTASPRPSTRCGFARRDRRSLDDQTAIFAAYPVDPPQHPDRSDPLAPSPRPHCGPARATPVHGQSPPRSLLAARGRSRRHAPPGPYRRNPLSRNHSPPTPLPSPHCVRPR